MTLLLQPTQKAAPQVVNRIKLKRNRDVNMSNKKMIIYGIILTIVTVGQIVLAFVFYNPEGNALVINIGWGVLMLSGIFGWFPIFTFRKRGNVKGRGYIHTTVLVDSGIYGIVRHPQYLAGVLMSIALPMITQHCLVVVLGLIAAIAYYTDTFYEEKACIEKFGDDYRHYMEQVPRMNFVLGIMRQILPKKRKTEKMSHISFNMMMFLFKVIDFIYPHIKKRILKFGIKEGMTVVDYGCGPGRYSIKFSELVGEKGKVYAVDIHELAVEVVKKKIEKYRLKNIEPILISGYNSTIPDNTADIICAIDMFFIIKNPTEFLRELKRIIRNDGILIIDDGHQSRSVTKKKILDSGLWDIFEEISDHLKCKPA